MAYIALQIEADARSGSADGIEALIQQAEGEFKRESIALATAQAIILSGFLDYARQLSTMKMERVHSERHVIRSILR